MKNLFCILMMTVGFLATPSAFAADKAARIAAQDARSTPLLPSQINADLSSWDSKNPFELEDYRVRYTATSVDKIDGYLVKTAQVQGTVVFTRYYIDQISAGNLLNVVTTTPLLVKMIQDVPNTIEELGKEGQKLRRKLPFILIGPNIVKMPQIVAAIQTASLNIMSLVMEVPALVKSLIALGKEGGALLQDGAKAVDSTP